MTNNPLTPAEQLAAAEIQNFCSHTGPSTDPASLCGECDTIARAVVSAMNPHLTPEDGYVVSWQFISPVEVMYMLRDQADRHARQLREQIAEMHSAIAAAEALLPRLDQAADDAEKSAELIAASDLFPTYSADIPERSGLSRPTSEEH
jgi:hypothetical protein